MDTSKTQVSSSLVKRVIYPPHPDSHKGQNGRILIIGSSPLFHGAGELSVAGALETVLSFATKTNDMVYFCSTKENLEYLKKRYPNFIGILREQIGEYLNNADVILIGPGLMREEDKNLPQSQAEPGFTLKMTKKVLSTDKKAVLDAGSLQVIKPEDLKGNTKTIITPHRIEMSRLFNLDPESLKTSHKMELKELKDVAQIVWEIAKSYQITILLKGPVDIIASSVGWYYAGGGNAGMTKGGTGDVLAGITAAIYTRNDDPLLVASAASFIAKASGEKLWEKNLWIFNSADLANNISKTLIDLLKSDETS